ncbi:MAG: hypothetical protein CMJ76_06365 [Planctomycetaceae bacterium]|nr:hypothetical protein [Planctomycetaceae bacterium]
MRFLFSFIVFLLTVTCHGQSSYETEKDIEFANIDGVSLKLDAYLLRAETPMPCIVYVHGGGFTSGDKAQIQAPIFEPLMQLGFSYISINYRLAPEVTYPTLTDDVERAIAFIKANTKRFNVNPDKLVLMGDSAGGLLVSYVGAKHKPGNEVAGVISFFGEHDLVIRASENPCAVDGKTIARPKGGCISAGLAAYLGFKEVTAETRKLLAAASCVTHVDEDMPPYLLLHGTRDYGVPIEQSISMYQTMRKRRNYCRLVSVVGGNHGIGSWSQPGQQHYKAALRQFLTKQVLEVE